MKTIAIRPTANSFVPQMSVYERQKLVQQMHEQKLEKMRKEQAEERARQEMLETTFRPKINQNYQPQDSFFERQNKHLQKIQRREQILNEVKHEKEEKYNYKPTINPVSLYIVEQMQKQHRLDTRSQMNQSMGLTTQQLQQKQQSQDERSALFDSMKRQANPKISDFAQQLEFQSSVYDRLYKTHGSYKESAGPRQPPDDQPSQLSKQQQQLLQDLHVKHMIEYQKIYDQKRQKQIEKAQLAERQFQSPSDSHQILNDQLIQRRNQRIVSGATYRKPYQEAQFRYQPEITKASRMLASKNTKNFYDRLEEYEVERQVRINQREQERQLNEVKECRFKPETNARGGDEELRLEDFLQRQQDYIDRRNNLQKEILMKKRMEEEENVRYTLEHCNKFRAKGVPQHVRERFLVNDKQERLMMATQLQNGDIETVKKLETIGGGNLVVGSSTVDSINKFVTRIRDGKVACGGLYGQQNEWAGRD